MERSDLTELATRAELVGIRTQLVSVRETSDSEPEERHISLAWQHDGSLVGVLLHFSEQYRPAEGSGAPDLDLHIHVEARFALPEGVNPDDSTLDLFAHSTGMLTTYPYLRELVSSLTMRAGYPPLTLPLHPLPRT